MKETNDGILIREAIEWSSRWGEMPPEEVLCEMKRIEEKAARILEGSEEKLTPEEIYYLNNKDNEIF